MCLRSHRASATTRILRRSSHTNGRARCRNRSRWLGVQVSPSRRAISSITSKSAVSGASRNGRVRPRDRRTPTRPNTRSRRRRSDACTSCNRNRRRRRRPPAAAANRIARPRRARFHAAHCSACDTVRLFKVADGFPIIRKLATVDEEVRQEERERKLNDERAVWAEAFENAVAPWRG